MAGRRFKKRRRFGGFKLKSKRVYSRYEAVYKFFAVNAICALASSAAYAFLARSAAGEYIVAFALLYGVLGVWIGYGISAFWGALTACERVRYESSYEAIEKYFSLGTLIPAVITAILPSLAVGRAAYRLTATVTSSGAVIYNDASAVPAIFGIAFFICLLIGCALWFIPYNKVISVGNVIPLGIIFLIIALAGAVFFGVGAGFLTANFIFFVFCSMAVINQGYLIKIINDSGTGSATPEVRKYNLAAVAMAFAVIAAAGFFATALIVGIVVSARIIFYSVFKTALNNGDGGESGTIASSPSFNVSEKLFGKVLDMEGEGKAIFYYVVFLVMILVFIAVLIIYRKRDGKRFPRPSEILGRIYAFILKLLSTIGVWINSKTASEGDVALPDYTDEELTVDLNAELGEFNFQGRDGVRRFNRLIGKCKNEGERLSICYRAARAEYMKRYSVIKKGDTPAEMLKKLRGVTAEWEYLRFERMTDAFSAFAYAGREPNEDIAIDVKDEIQWIIAALSADTEGR